jgi:hypothetical protein
MTGAAADLRRTEALRYNALAAELASVAKDDVAACPRCSTNSNPAPQERSARAASGHVAGAPPSGVMYSRRFTLSMGLPPRNHCASLPPRHAHVRGAPYHPHRADRSRAWALAGETFMLKEGGLHHDAKVPHMRVRRGGVSPNRRLRELRLPAASPLRRFRHCLADTAREGERRAVETLGFGRARQASKPQRRAAARIKKRHASNRITRRVCIPRTVSEKEIGCSSIAKFDVSYDDVW